MKASGFHLERLISAGQATPAGQWYDQETHEWVVLLSGSAGLLFEGEPEIRVLRPGDYLLIPAHCRHRVEWTDPEKKTVWLALHYQVCFTHDMTRRMRPLNLVSGRFQPVPFLPLQPWRRGGGPGGNRSQVACAKLCSLNLSARGILSFSLISSYLSPHLGRAAPMNRAEIRANLATHLEYLSVSLGERSIYRPQNLQAAEDYVLGNFQRLGYHPSARATPTCARK